MKWGGETSDQREARMMKWHRCFLLIPAQMDNGRWVWLETVWRIAEPNCRGGLKIRFSDNIERPSDRLGPTSAPPPRKK